MANLPQISKKQKICIICEGLEDHSYINRLEELQVWKDVYDFVPVNVKSASNIFPRYQNEYNNNSYSAILVFCDTDKAPYREYAQVKRKINEFHNKTSASSKVVIFANPCTMQIILSHFGDVMLTTQSKRTNAPLIYDLTGVADYDAHEDQVKAICRNITRTNYEAMKLRIANINRGDQTTSSTNFMDFIEKFESDDLKWIKALNKALSE
jgi:hypothetical protein